MAELHKCEVDAPFDGYGVAVSECYENGGLFFVSNEEHCSQVDFCPFCGTRAPVAIDAQWRERVAELNQGGSWDSFRAALDVYWEQLRKGPTRNET